METIDPFVVNAAGTYTAPNINQAVTNPAGEPDLLGIRNSINNELNVGGLTTDFNNANTGVNTAVTDLEGLNQGIQDQTLNMNVIRGEQGRATEVGSQKISALQRVADAKAAALNAARMEANDRFNIKSGEVNQMKQLILSNPDAGITFGDSMQTAASKITAANTRNQVKSLMVQYPNAKIKEGDDLQTVQSKLKKSIQEEQKQAEKDNNKKMFAQVFGYTPKKFGDKEKKKLKAYYEEERNYTKQSRSKALSASSAGNDKQTLSDNIDYTDTILSEARRNQKNRASEGWDGFLSPDVWKPIYKEWTASGGSRAEFKKQFLGQKDKDGNYASGYINPEDF